MKSRPRAFNIVTFTVPILYCISAPWVVKHLIESRVVSNWKPTLIRKVSPSEIQAGRFGKWHRIRIGEEVDLPIIVKEIKEQKAGIAESGGGTVSGDFEFTE